MRLKKIKRLVSIATAVVMMLSFVPDTGFYVKADSNLAAVVEEKLVIEKSEINQLLTEDLQLPNTISDLPEAGITYSVGGANASYVSVESSLLKITRPYAGENDYSFTLTATVENGGESCTKDFPLTIRAGLSDDTYAGYIYTCFATKNIATTGSDYRDDQQVHFFLSEDGLNWTALNGCNPAFLTGTDYLDLIEPCGKINYTVSMSADIKETVQGDASVLFPFEGNDQGIRDPYLIRGAKADGSDADKIWLLATDLNSQNEKYGGNGNRRDSEVGDWQIMDDIGSTSLFIYETEDWIHWERRWIDVGESIGAGAAWAPEAIYNPEKDNYLVYWSNRIIADGLERNRLYCAETEDFVNFGPTKLYEQEPFYLNGRKILGPLDGYGNIDTSQLWVADEDGNPYGTLFRLVKDETDKHIELMSAETVLDPNVNYNETDPTRITPYYKDGVTYYGLTELNTYGTSVADRLYKADIVYNWFLNESVGNHFVHILNTDMEKLDFTYEGATMFKFIDRDEWCVMIDNYADHKIRYEPYLTTDLSEPESIKKAAQGTYGRTAGDVGCHGGMIPITVEEYNTLIDTYNADDSVDNYHDISYIEVDKRELQATMEWIRTALKDTSKFTQAQITELNKILKQGQAALDDPASSSEVISVIVSKAEAILDPAAISVDKTSVSLEIGKTATVKATVYPENDTVTWTTANSKVATVKNGVITGVGIGSTVITVKSSGNVTASVNVTVTGTPGLSSVTAKPVKSKIAKGGSTTVKINYPATVSARSPKADYKASGAVSVTKTGKITGKKAGTGNVTVTITIPSTGEKITRTVTVKVGAITKKSVKAGKTVKLKVNGLTGKVTWTIVKNKKLASINKSGVLTGKKKGTVTVQAKIGNVKIKQKITVNK